MTIRIDQEHSFVKIVKIGSQLGPPLNIQAKIHWFKWAPRTKVCYKYHIKKKKRATTFILVVLHYQIKKQCNIKCPKEKIHKILGYIRIYFSISTSSHSSPQTKKKISSPIFFFILQLPLLQMTFFFWEFLTV